MIMRAATPLICFIALLLCVGCSTMPEQTYFTATEKDEAADGWLVLFDGTSTKHFAGMKGKDVPERWVIEDGTLHYTGGKFGGDLVTKQAFGDFDLRWEWKLSEGGNSGIKYRIDPDKPVKIMYALGPEYQILDDAKHRDGKNPTHRVGALYDLIAPAEDKKVKPIGEWNESRILMQGNKVEHWLNGEIVVAYELWSEDFNQRLAKSKYKNESTFAKKHPGHIVLQEHEDKVWYRNIRIRELPAE